MGNYKIKNTAYDNCAVVETDYMIAHCHYAFFRRALPDGQFTNLMKPLLCDLDNHMANKDDNAFTTTLDEFKAVMYLACRNCDNCISEELANYTVAQHVKFGIPDLTTEYNENIIMLSKQIVIHKENKKEKIKNNYTQYDNEIVEYVTNEVQSYAKIGVTLSEIITYLQLNSGDNSVMNGIKNCCVRLTKKNMFITSSYLNNTIYAPNTEYNAKESKKESVKKLKNQ
jgi:urease gamma subunit